MVEAPAPGRQSASQVQMQMQVQQANKRSESEMSASAFGVDSTNMDFEGDGMLSPEAGRAVSGVLLAKAKAKVQAQAAAKKQWGAGWRDPRETGEIEMIPVNNEEDGGRRGSGDSSKSRTSGGDSAAGNSDNEYEHGLGNGAIAKSAAITTAEAE